MQYGISSGIMANTIELLDSEPNVPKEEGEISMNAENNMSINSNNVQPDPVTIATSTSVRIGEQPQQSAIDQGDVSEVATLTINSGQELQSTPEKMNASDVFNPEIVKPLLKAPRRLQTATKRRIRKTAVLTDTSEKNGSAEEHAKKKAKKNGDITNKGKENNNNKENGNAKRKIKEKAREKAERRVLQESDSDSNEDLECNCTVCCDS
ncbi:hypothetical protein WA026_004260 [Henosepilachna vigintioctopunctata]|uniref:Uncharacterized protein n=1 Tax=Henosepilachna vigintioctopunctata TaxID=420089 RepID=A0AAW1V9S2_9CUCU